MRRTLQHPRRFIFHSLPGSFGLFQVTEQSLQESSLQKTQPKGSMDKVTSVLSFSARLVLQCYIPEVFPSPQTSKSPHAALQNMPTYLHLYPLKTSPWWAGQIPLGSFQKLCNERSAQRITSVSGSPRHTAPRAKGNCCATQRGAGCGDGQHSHQPACGTWLHGQGLTTHTTRGSFDAERPQAKETGQRVRAAKEKDQPGSWQWAAAAFCPPSSVRVRLCDTSSRLATPRFKIQDTVNITLCSIFSLTSLKTWLHFYP